MATLTILLVAIFFAAWKAPRWVKEIGKFALIFGFLSFVLGLMQMFQALQQVAMDLDSNSVSGIFDLISPGRTTGSKFPLTLSVETAKRLGTFPLP